jgi:TRAP-type uncharacterized transport system substrate-binding protein
MRFDQSNPNIGRREFLKASAAIGGAIVLGGSSGVLAQPTKRISIATGGMGGVYFPLGVCR